MDEVTAMAILQERARSHARLNRDGWQVLPAGPTPRERLAGILVALAVRLAPLAAAGGAHPSAGGLGRPTRA